MSATRLGLSVGAVLAASVAARALTIAVPMPTTVSKVVDWTLPWMAAFWVARSLDDRVEWRTWLSAGAVILGFRVILDLFWP